MRATWLFTGLIVAAAAGGFALGRWQAIWTRGFHYQIQDSKTHPSPNGSVEWRYVTKTVGVPVIDPGTTELHYRDRLLFSVNRGFQEAIPFVQDIRFDGKTLEWNDGELDYVLKITERETPRSPALPTAP